MTAALNLTPNHGAWIQVHSGTAFDLLNPTADQIHLDDIAIALARAPRFGGHTRDLYTVAQHSLVVADLLISTGAQPDVILQGLLHDATEAYVVDVPRPLKAMLSEYKAIENRVWAAVADKFCLPVDLDPAVKWADEEALLHEANHLLPGGAQGWGSDPTTLRAPRVLLDRMGEGELRERFTRAVQEYAPIVKDRYIERLR